MLPPDGSDWLFYGYLDRLKGHDSGGSGSESPSIYFSTGFMWYPLEAYFHFFRLW